MESSVRAGLRGGHPTAWKFRQWSAPERDGLRRLRWASSLGEFHRGPKETDLVIPELFEEQVAIVNNLTDQGENDMVRVYFGNQAVRASLFMRAYNDTLVESDTLSTATNEVSGTGYAALTYTRNTDWSVTGSVATGATKVWTAGGAWTPMTFVALATVGTGTGGLMINYVPLSATRTLAASETLDVTPTVTAT
jgi:hypothetical protein